MPAVCIKYAGALSGEATVDMDTSIASMSFADMCALALRSAPGADENAAAPNSNGRPAGLRVQGMRLMNAEWEWETVRPGTFAGVAKPLDGAPKLMVKVKVGSAASRPASRQPSFASPTKASALKTRRVPATPPRRRGSGRAGTPGRSAPPSGSSAPPSGSSGPSGPSGSSGPAEAPSTPARAPAEQPERTPVRQRTYRTPRPAAPSEVGTTSNWADTLRGSKKKLAAPTANVGAPLPPPPAGPAGGPDAGAGSLGGAGRSGGSGSGTGGGGGPTAPSATTTADRDTLAQQVELLKAVTGLSDAEIQWKLDSAKGDAYGLATQRLERAEEAYDRLLFRDCVLGEVLELLAGGSLQRAIEAGGAELDAAVEAQAAAVEAGRGLVSVKTCVQRAKQAAASETVRAKVVAAELEQLQTIQREARQEQAQVRARMDKALAGIELWRERQRTAPNYADALRAEEAAWAARNAEANAAALALMRSYIPVDIQQLTTADLVEQAADRDVVLTQDLAAYLKETKLLHWVTIHSDDLKNRNFLAGADAADFQNLSRYDLVEMRAVYAVLPEEFGLDKDGRKAAWRRDFVARLRAMVQQADGDTVRAGWDPVNKRRAEVALPPLKPAQRRNAVYHYPTEQQIEARLGKLRAQATRLTTRRARIAELDGRIEEAKSEYNAISADSRSKELRQAYGKDTLVALRQEAKAEHAALVKERADLARQVKATETALSNGALTAEAYEAEVDRIRASSRPLTFFTVAVEAEDGGDGDGDGPSEPQEWAPLQPSADFPDRGAAVPGCFPTEPDINPRRHSLARMLSVEEDALQRKAELNSALEARRKAPAPAPVSAAAQPVPARNRGRRGSVLDSTAPELTAFLERQFAGAAASSAAAAPPAAPPQDVKPKSKRLQALLDRAGSPPPIAGPATGRPSLSAVASSSFLQELRSRSNSAPASAGGGASFLQELQARRSGSSAAPASAGGASFLQELQARRSGSSGSSAAPAPAAGKPSFLQELQARAAPAAPAAPEPAKNSFLEELRSRSGAAAAAATPAKGGLMAELSAALSARNQS